MSLSSYLVVLVFLTDYLCCALIDAKQSKEQNGTLVLLHVLFRHGDRTPEASELYPNDPFVNETYYPLAHGELTNTGKLREYMIGKELRSMYNDYLGSYTSSSAYARSTHYKRTRESCELVLAGLYSPTSKQLWNKHLSWQPTPCDYVPYEEDQLLGDPLVYCPKYIKQYYKYLLSAEGRQIYVKNQELYEYLTEHSGWDVRIPNYPYQISFALTAEEGMGFTLPEWTRNVWPENITVAAAEEYKVFQATPFMKRVTGGYLLKKIVDDTKAKIEGKLPSALKIFLYSAHENNLAYMLLLLDIFHVHIPPYGSYITLEVHNINGVYGIKILYQDYTNDDGPKQLKLPNCDIFCPISEFTKLVQEYFPDPAESCV